MSRPSGSGGGRSARRAGRRRTRRSAAPPKSGRRHRDRPDVGAEFPGDGRQHEYHEEEIEGVERPAEIARPDRAVLRRLSDLMSAIRLMRRSPLQERLLPRLSPATRCKALSWRVAFRECDRACRRTAKYNGRDAELRTPNIEQRQCYSKDEQAERQRWDRLADIPRKLDCRNCDKTDNAGRHPFEEAVKPLVFDHPFQMIIKE